MAGLPHKKRSTPCPEILTFICIHTCLEGFWEKVPRWLTYDFPPAVKAKVNHLWGGEWHGQAQKWFLMRLTKDESEVNLASGETETEFSEWKWASPDEVIEQAVDYKRPTYEEVMTTFRPYLSERGIAAKCQSTRTVKEKAAASTKRKHKSIEEIMGIPKAGNSKKGAKKNKQKKAVVFRAAIVEAALSVSSGGINNRNRILLNEAEAVWAVSKILGEDYSGDDEEVISRIMLREEQDEDRAAQLNNDLLIA